MSLGLRKMRASSCEDGSTQPNSWPHPGPPIHDLDNPGFSAQVRTVIQRLRRLSKQLKTPQLERAGSRLRPGTEHQGGPPAGHALLLAHPCPSRSQPSQSIPFPLRDLLGSFPQSEFGRPGIRSISTLTGWCDLGRIT